MADFLIYTKKTLIKIFIMKKTDTHSALLGLSHGQMSLLLKVHPSQWSMYESGKRNLPLKAKKILSQMIRFLKLEDRGSKVQQHLIEQEESKKEYLKKLTKSNEFNLYEINKRIALDERNYKANIQVIGLVEYLKKLPSTKGTFDVELLDSIASKAERALKKSGLANLTKLRLKEALLQQEKLLLESTVNEIKQTYSISTIRNFSSQ